MTKTHKLPKNIFFAFFATIMLAISCLLASCGGPSEPPATMYSVTWDVSEKATVAVEGYEALPTQVAEDTDLVFTVTTAEGYEVSRVTRDSKKVTAKDGKYTVSITKDTKIGVETGKVITGIEVTKNPTKLTYFAGDALDVTGMEVKVNYATGDSEVITKGADGYLVSPSIFEGGETSFKVMYDDFEAVVNLDGRVEYLVTIDPTGGTIAPSYLANLEALSLNNYNVSDAGVITFSYFNNIQGSIALPTESEMSRPDYAFMGWSTTETTITNASLTFSTSAKWQAELVSISGVELVSENDHAYLVVHGQFKVANEVYLFLKEGNKNITFTGDTYTNTTGENGAPFEVKFDLNKLAEATAEDGSTYEGAWMDIRFNAKLGEREESMELYVGEGSTINVDMGDKASLSKYIFAFQQHNGMLKVYYNQALYTYTTVFQKDVTINYVDENGDAQTKVDDALIIAGSAPDYKGHTFKLTAWANAEIDLGESAIDDNGNFRIVIDLENIPLETKTYVHVHILSADGETVHGGTSTDFSIISCINQSEMVKLPKKVGDVTHGIRFVDENNVATYSGYQWGGLILHRQVELGGEFTYDSAAIANVNDRAILTITGTYKDIDEALVIANSYLDFQYKGDWSYTYPEITVTAENGVWTITVDVTEYGEGQYICHGAVGKVCNPGSGPNLNISTSGEYSVVVGTLQYTIVTGDNAQTDFWGALGLTVTQA